MKFKKEEIKKNGDFLELIIVNLKIMSECNEFKFRDFVFSSIDQLNDIGSKSNIFSKSLAKFRGIIPNFFKNIKELSCHSYRHITLSMMVEKYGVSKTLSVSGHKNINTIMNYIQGHGSKKFEDDYSNFLENKFTDSKKEIENEIEENKRRYNVHYEQALKELENNVCN